MRNVRYKEKIYLAILIEEKCTLSIKFGQLESKTTFI